MTAILRESDGIKYSLLGIEDLDQVAQLVGLVFTDGSEPVTRQLRVGSHDFALLVRSLCPKFSSDGLSVVARDARTGEVVGAQLNDDMGTEIPNVGQVHEWAAPVFALLDELDRSYFGDQAVEPNQYAHFFFMAVLPGYRRRGISAQLLELSLAIASMKGYRKATVEATGLISQHVLHKAGFEARVEIPYSTFDWKGAGPFQGIKDHPAALLMDRVLTRDLQSEADGSGLPKSVGVGRDEEPTSPG